MSENALPAGTQITLAFSATAGIVAVAGGARYSEAMTILAGTGFSRREDGTSVLTTADPDAARRTLTDLTRMAADRNMTLTAGSRVWLGDTAARIATLLPGSWTARIEVYCLPVWQRDLDGAVWDAGALGTALRRERVPYAAVLDDGLGTELLMADKPGTAGEVLIGAFIHPDLPAPLRAGPGDPRSLTTSAEPAAAARAITRQLLPAYRAAVHNRRTEEVATHLAHALNAEIARTLVRGDWPPEDGTGLGASILARLEHHHREVIWSDFLPFLVHGPALLDHLETVTRQPGTLPREDHAALAGLRRALQHGQNVRSAWTATLNHVRDRPGLPPSEETYAEAVAARNAEAGPALDAWLKHGPALVDLVRRHPPAGARPARRPALPRATPADPPGTGRGKTP